MRMIRRCAVVLSAMALAMAGMAVASALTADAGVPAVPALNAMVDPDPTVPGDETEVFPSSPADVCPVAQGTDPADYDLFWSVERSDAPGTEIDGGDEALSSDGDWTAFLTTDDYQPGEHTFIADCVFFPPAPASVGPAGAPGTTVATYDQTFEVAGELDPFQATLDKYSGPPGDDIELGAIACFGDSGAALLMPAGAVPPFSPDLEGLQQYDVLENQFGGVAPVPADTPPGTYQVVAWCLEGGQPNADPVVLSYTVLAPGAEAVPAAPDFTG